MAEALPIKNSIEDLANEVRGYTVGRHIPVNMERAVISLGGKITGTPYHEMTKEKYRRGVVKTGEKSFLLQIYAPYALYEMDSLIHDKGYLSLSLTDWRLSSHGRYEIAHLLGHLFLHMGYKDERWEHQGKFRDALKYALEDHPRLEMEANRFAQTFLMPEKGFRQIAQKNFDKGKNKYSLRGIAAKFNVPSLAVERYGERLDIFKKEEEPQHATPKPPKFD
ncbi:ImmA/IrrE family metallo-endopeptidase [Candidatus Woesearchaeota archaeon]|nr:ImmA/IrrE family metallo-endopeptidase [Candidatus Woesearchaeota archaeon]